MQTVIAFVAHAFQAVASGGAQAAGSASTAAAATETAASAAAASTAAASTAAASTAAASTAASTAAAAASTAANAAGWGSKVLSALRVGTSVVSALSIAGQDRMQAEALRQEAADENLQARQEFIQGLQSANDIERRYNELVQDQMAVAAAEGIDVASGSVIDARNQARSEADRQLATTRSGIEMNAAVRKGRASYLAGAAALTSQVGVLSAGAKVGQAALDARRVG